MVIAQLKIAAIGGLVALLVGFGAGWKTKTAFCDAAATRAQSAHDARQHNARDAADASEAQLFPEQERDLSALKEPTDAISGKISVGECFAAGDVDRLRELWRGP